MTLWCRLQYEVVQILGQLRRVTSCGTLCSIILIVILIVVGGHLFEIFATRGLGGSYWDTSYIHIFVILILIRLLEPLHWLAVLFLSLFLIGYWRDWGPPT